jgi:predicted ribosomally synthesized peptide with SipW-like signal peptide
MLVIGLVGSLAGAGTFSAFSSTTSNDGNSFAAGTVFIDDNDGGSAMYNVSNQKPDDTVAACIKVTYTGSLDADVAIYASAVGAVGNYIDLAIRPGTGNAADCSDFAPDAADLYSGTLKNFADTHSDFGTGLADYPGAGTEWATSDSVTYRFTVTLQDDNNANGGSGGPLSTGAHSFTWEAQNQ